LGGHVKAPTLNRHVKLKVRKGTQPGSLIRLRGEGIKHLRHSGHGDLYVKIVVDIPKNLNRQQKDLLKKLQKEGL
jgi:molecular chaperone DnaJ